jgi:hypothetical protein
MALPGSNKRMKLRAESKSYAILDRTISEGDSGVSLTYRGRMITAFAINHHATPVCHAKNAVMRSSGSGGCCCTGDMGNTPGTKRVIEGLQGPLLQIDVAEIIIHETNEPNAIVDLLDAERLTFERG